MVAALLPTITACQSVGPSRKSISSAATQAAIPGLHVVDLTDNTVAQANGTEEEDRNLFVDMLGGAEAVGTRVGVGDTLEVTIWEAAPAALFATTNLTTTTGASIEGSRPNTLPGFLVGPSGMISIPFAGEIRAAGRTTREIEQEVVRRLQGRAHLPQAVVRVAHNVSATVTVLGDVKQPSQVSLTPHGERVLDALSQVGGTNAPLDRTTIQLTRGGIVERMPAKDIIDNPDNNVVLKSGDVVTVLYQPYSFTVLGAAGKNDEIRFEGTGLTLSQALGRIGGLQSDRADPRGVFIFRWQKPTPTGAIPDSATGGVPVIYRIDLKQPATYLAAQRFQMHDGDVLFISNSPVADFQRFATLVATSILPISTARAVVP